MFRAMLFLSESKNTKLMGMDGQYGATNISYAEPFPAVQEVQQLAFRADYRYLLAAATVMFIATGAVLPTLWGWWELGRPVTLSPTETGQGV